MDWELIFSKLVTTTKLPSISLVLTIGDPSRLAVGKVNLIACAHLRQISHLSEPVGVDLYGIELYYIAALISVAK